MNQWQHGLSYILMKDALSSDGCPICTLLVSWARKNLFWFLYENLNNPYIRKQLYESNGYCQTHAWLIYQIEREEWNDNLGVAIIYRDLIEKANRDLKAIKLSKPKFHLRDLLKLWKAHLKPKDALKLLSSRTSCPMCLHQQEMESVYISSLIESLAFPDFRELYQNSYGLCLEHFSKVITNASDEEIKEFLLTVQRSKLQRLNKLLEKYIREHDYRFAEGEKGEEINSPKWAIEMLVGKRIQ